MLVGAFGYVVPTYWKCPTVGVMYDFNTGHAARKCILHVVQYFPNSYTIDALQLYILAQNYFSKAKLHRTIPFSLRNLATLKSYFC